MAGHAFTNRFANPVLQRLLRGPLGRVPGRRLAVLRYTGRRSGAERELVCMYVRSAGTVWVLVGRPDAKAWWRNFREPAPADLWLAGAHVRARVVAVVGADRPEEAARGLTAFLAGMPSARRAVGLRPGVQPEEVAGRVVLVRADITG